MKRTRLWIAAMGMMVSVAVLQQRSVSQSTEPAAPEHQAPNKPASDQVKAADHTGLSRYHDADVQLGPPAPREKRVVFMGDSVTELWHFDKPGGEFANKPYINRGISGQTSTQMLLRFQQDVIDLRPSVVVILAGTNDIAQKVEETTIQKNLESMSDMASQNHIKVVLCSVLPAHAFPTHPDEQPAPQIARLNEWIKGYAAREGYVYVDYYSALKDAEGGLPPNLSKDGMHPNNAGHAIMSPLVEAGIKRALAR